MLSLPTWNSLNPTSNYFSSKCAHHGGLCPSLPPPMKVQVCTMDDIPCFTKGHNNSQPEDEKSPDSNEEEDNDSSNQIQLRNPTTSSLDDLYLSEKAKDLETVHADRLVNFTGFELLDDSDDDEVSSSTVGSIEATEKKLKTDRLSTFSGFGFEKIVDDEISVYHTSLWRKIVGEEATLLR